MDENSRLQLDNMIKEHGAIDYTEDIKLKKHSLKIFKDLTTFNSLNEEYNYLFNANFDKFEQICMTKCMFLFENYTNIFNKLIRREIDIDILNKLITVLKEIEDGESDQHNASFKVGNILKELYIDSALKKSKKIDEQYPDTKLPAKNINYSEWKLKNT